MEETETCHILTREDAWKYLEAFSNTDLAEVKPGDLYVHDRGFHYGWTHEALPIYLNDVTAVRVLGYEIKCKLELLIYYIN